MDILCGLEYRAVLSNAEVNLEQAEIKHSSMPMAPEP